MAVALGDFLYAFHAFPCFAMFPMDGRSEPLLDPSFFHYRDLLDPLHATTCGSNYGPALEVMLAESKSRELPRLLQAALASMKKMDIREAQRTLLSATYASELCLEEMQLEFDRGNITDCIDILHQLLVVTEPKEHDGPHGHQTPGRPLHRWNSVLTSVDTRRSIASDIYAYTACVLQTKHKIEEAKTALEKSVQLVSHNMFALLNCLQGNYFAALEAISRVIDLVHVKATVLHRSHEAMTSLVHMSFLTTPECIGICTTIASLLREYKALLTWEVGNHVSQLCVLQGKLAIQVEALRDVVAKQRDKEGGQQSLHLGRLNEALDRCAAEIIQRPPDTDAIKALVHQRKAARRRTVKLDVPSTSLFQLEYDRVCSQIATTLVAPGDTKEPQVPEDSS
ncbi:hypothetical protein ACHHYP_12034 [Achlya hypogyna]|uniref:Uncharacterized protein n=1 Tax=Achlya hypogyna TaxID=1202772 RepID=A0A1V9YHN1_ACHHY|nr:hypothetical protein ACHHYP_12034 [Achlya hypogyna]